jgi:hypothetical protein
VFCNAVLSGGRLVSCNTYSSVSLELSRFAHSKTWKMETEKIPGLMPLALRWKGTDVSKDHDASFFTVSTITA